MPFWVKVLILWILLSVIPMAFVYGANKGRRR
jgi:hypothetical protein